MRILLIIISCFLLNSLSAQTNNVRGEILDEKASPLPFATTVLFQTVDSTMVKASTTNLEGLFSIPISSAGEYYLIVSSVGYTEYQSPSFNADLSSGFDHGKLQLSSGVALDEVQVRARKPIIEVMPDKTVFNVENAGATAGLTGFELLRRAPGVIIDNNNNVIVEGKAGVEIWIDGKPSILAGEDLTAYLSSIQASDIEAIEIITQPSSKYDAEGSAGIINIKLKRDKRYGTNGNINTGVAYGQFFKNNNSISLNQRSKGMNIYGTYSNRFGKTFNDMEFKQQILGQEYREASRNEREFTSHNLTAGLDIYVSPKSTISLNVNGSLSDNSSFNDSRTDILALSSDASNALLLAESRDDSQQENVYVNANYVFEDTLGHRLSFDADYGFFNNESVSTQPNVYYTSEGGDITATSDFQFITPIAIDIISSKIDYEMSALGGKLGLGAKAVEVQTKNVFDFSERIEEDYVLSPERSNEFDYTERVIAGYVNYGYSKDKWSAQMGVRAEHTYSLGVLEALQDVDDDQVERAYLNFFPSAGLTYQANQTNALSLNYSRRVRRPDYASLNPFEQRMNELSFRKGNPFLRPNYTHNLKMAHTYEYRFTTSLSYSYVQDFYAQVTDTLSLDNGTGFLPSFIQARNVADEQVVSLSISAPFDVKEWWSVYLNMTGSNTSYTSTDDKFNPINQSTFNFYGQNTFKLPKDWSLEVSGWFSSPSIWGGTFKTKSLGSLDMAVKHKFWQDRLTGSLAMSDILYTSPWRATGEFNNLSMSGGGAYESRQVRLNLSYNFGNPELKQRKKRSGASDDELDRIN